MSAAPAEAAETRGRVDGEGRLAEADPLLAALNARAGGKPGGPIAVPQLAAVARLAARLGMAISRSILAADGDNDLHLWVRAAPDRRGGVALALSGWEEQPARAPQPARPAQRAADFARAAADWTWATDEQLRLTQLSADAAAAIGETRAAVLGRVLTDLLALEPDARGGMTMLEAMGHARDFHGQPARLRGSAGAAPLLLEGQSIKDAEGRFVGFRGTASFGAAAGAGEDAFSAALGEALRAPLDRIIAAADRIRGEGEGPVRAEYADYAGDIASAGRHLLALVGDLVDLQAIEHPGFSVAAERFDLADCARRAAALLAGRAAERGVRFELPDAEAELAAEGDPRRALQVLVNLIGNAVRYSPPEDAVAIRIEPAGDRVRVTVADRGKGIAPDHQARIFDKFERVDPSEPGGTGLGLYIARRLARAMGGDVVVESAEGEGARFTLSLRGG